MYICSILYRRQHFLNSIYNYKSHFGAWVGEGDRECMVIENECEQSALFASSIVFLKLSLDVTYLTTEWTKLIAWAAINFNSKRT